MISIVVCTYNREQYLPKMLESAANQQCSKGDFELIIVNNKSSDNTAELCAQFLSKNPSQAFSYFLEENQGLSFARNRGIRESKGDYIVFVDDDAFLDVNYISELKKYLSKMPELIGFGGKILPYLECELPQWMSKYLSSLMSIIDLGTEVKLFTGSKYPIGANMGVSRKVIENIGVFNESLGRTGNSMLGGEEKDFFYRIKEAGIPIYYFPKMLVHHVIPAKRLTVEFIKKQAEGIGLSEKLRTKKSGEYLKRSLLELYKWGGTIALWFIYLFKMQTSKGNMLIKFRYWISKGLWA